MGGCLDPIELQIYLYPSKERNKHTNQIIRLLEGYILEFFHELLGRLVDC